MSRAAFNECLDERHAFYTHFTERPRRKKLTITSALEPPPCLVDGAGRHGAFGRDRGEDAPQTAPRTSSTTPRGNHAGAGSASSVSKTPEPKRNQAIRLQRQPRLPKEGIKIVLTPRAGFDVAKLNDAQIRESVLSAAAIKKEEAGDDLLWTSPKQNIIVVGTPKVAHA
ncbi:hypothetical protein HPB48_006563 [Haemaphysalis longicornis]|uniref:Uncharacterized protein n=1 Tax=Haemaphysalis longicornis TaxID=44386 RepID=A0A9J6GDE5_HAELO|nr:hypothetical protein HPB48_006563 [Haemaphysalis longicornis]